MGEAIMAWFRVEIPHDVWTAGDVIYVERTAAVNGKVRNGLLVELEASIDTGKRVKPRGKSARARQAQGEDVRLGDDGSVRGEDGGVGGDGGEERSSGSQAE